MTFGLAAILCGAFVALTIGSGIRWLSLRPADRESVDHDRRLRSSLAVWWILLIVFSLALLAGKFGLAVLFGVASLMGIFEFHHNFAKSPQGKNRLVLIIAGIAVAHYSLILFADSLWIQLATSHVLLMGICLEQIVGGRLQDYLRTTAGYYWFSMLLIVGLSYAVASTELPVSSNAWNAGVVGWTMFLVLLTETNDIAQGLVGRWLGKHKILPRVSPGKTWEGLAGGVAVTAGLAACLAGPLTTLTEDRSAIAGVLVSLLSGVLLSLAGFLGDMNISAWKREAGLKDSSQLLPGMGGVLDRLDSLSFAAPTLFCLAMLLG